MRCHIERNEFKKAEALIRDMRNLKELRGFNSTDMEVKIFTSSYNLELRLLHTMGKFHQSIQLIPEIESKQRYFGEKINKEQVMKAHKAKENEQNKPRPKFDPTNLSGEVKSRKNEWK